MPKVVILSFERTYPDDTIEFRRLIKSTYEKKNIDLSDEDITVLYPADLSQDKYMTWSGSTPNAEEIAALQSLQAGDKVYFWAHGSASSGYITGGFYTEIANYLARGLNKDNFSPSKGALEISVLACESGRGGYKGETSFAAQLHAYLGKIGIFSTVKARTKLVWVDYETIAQEGIKTVSNLNYALHSLGINISKANFAKHQAPKSKVSYIWDPQKPEEQIRIDSYRKNLLSKV